MSKRSLVPQSFLALPTMMPLPARARACADRMNRKDGAFQADTDRRTEEELRRNVPSPTSRMSLVLDARGSGDCQLG